MDHMPPDENQKNQRDKIQEVFRELSRLYPDARSVLLEPSRGDPVDVLVATILSQSTSDILSARAFKNLRDRFSAWDRVLCCEDSEVEKCLAVCGLQREKTRKIKAALSKILEDFGAITLEPLRSMRVEAAFEYLVSLPGVGPKTAACVLAFGLNKPAFPVDTHVLRIARRLGLVGARDPAARAQEMLERMVPDSIKASLHLMLIQHGREICSARKPRCQDCPLAPLCSYRREGGPGG